MILMDLLRMNVWQSDILKQIKTANFQTHKQGDLTHAYNTYCFVNRYTFNKEKEKNLKLLIKFKN